MLRICLYKICAILCILCISYAYAEEVATVGSSYCSTKFPDDMTGYNMCITCLENNAILWGDACVSIDQACIQTYSSVDKQAECQEKYTLCLANNVSADRCLCKATNGILLNTNVPFIGSCIYIHKNSPINPTNAFPYLLAGLMRIVMTIILIFCFLAIVVAGVMISMGGADQERAKKGKRLIGHVVVALALLGASGVILRLINPNFFQ